MTAVTVRALAEGDHDAWRPLWDGYNAFYGRLGPTALPVEITDLTWRRMLDAAEPVNGLAAVSDGQLVGITHYIFHRSTTAVAPVCYLQDLFTDPALRGQGVGRALIEGVYAAAHQAGSPRVYWQTHETNATARQLYDRIAERSGFIVYRRDF